MYIYTHTHTHVCVCVCVCLCVCVCVCMCVCVCVCVCVCRYGRGIMSSKRSKALLIHIARLLFHQDSLMILYVICHTLCVRLYCASTKLVVLKSYKIEISGTKVLQF
jgi:hypothetical protein